MRDALPLVQAPTLVLHRTGDRDANVEEGRYIAERIPGAKFVELPGDDHMPLVDSDQILDEVEEFLTGTKPAPVSERVLATVLFTDLVGSTERARELGDRPWAELLERHHEAVRRELARFGCEEIDTAGDGFLALGEGPTSTIRCALSIRDAVAPLGSERPCGRPHRRGGAAARRRRRAGSPCTSAPASPRRPARTRCFVSSTTSDLVAGSGIDARGPRRVRAEGRRAKASLRSRHDRRSARYLTADG